MNEQTASRYLDYLPAIYREDPFLGRFLLPFEAELTRIEDLLASVDRYCAPALTDSEFLPWLASWVALVLDEEWDEARRRRLIGEAVTLYRWRGTPRGLKRYLEIYTNLAPDIREWRWPGGMQIGVASRIGGTDPDAPIPPSITGMAHPSPVSHDYYVVEGVAPADHPDVPEGKPLRLYYRADRVEKVEVGDEHVDIWRFPPGDGPSTKIHHEPATVTRRDGLVEDIYTLEAPGGMQVQYTGDTFLVDEVELPYRFVVDVRVPSPDMEKVKLDKVRAIVELEKPAHTAYYLRLTPVVSRYLLRPMQVEVRSSIGVDTTTG